MAYVARALVFFTFVALGLWGFAVLPEPWNWIAFVVGFLVGGVSSMLTFKKLATDDQIKTDLEARLHND